MKRYRTEDDDKENTLADEPYQKKTRPNLTPVKKVYRPRAKNVLCLAAQGQVKRLGGVVPGKVNPTPYRSNMYCRPVPQQQFCNIRWTPRSVFKSDQFQLRNVVFGNPMIDWNSFAFLRNNNDALVIGAGRDETLLVTKQREGENVDHSDFEVWLIDRQHQEGPFPIAMILASLEPDTM
jgi:hypothetical protein